MPRPSRVRTPAPTRPDGIAAVYARMSMDRTGAGLGIDRQVAECLPLLHRRGYEEAQIEVFADNDISAFTGKRRPDYERLLEAIRDGRVTHLATWHNDRLHRRPIELEEFIDIVDKAKVGIDTVTAGSFDLSTPAGRLIARNLGAAARFESEHKSERILARKRQNRQLGLPHGGPRPFGWSKMTLTDRNGASRETWDPRKPDPEEAQLIVDAAKAVIAGTSLTAIARQWNEAGVQQPQVRKRKNARDEVALWSPTAVKQIVTSPRNAGLVPHYRYVKDEDGKVHEVRDFAGKGDWPAIIDRPTWERCREVLEGRSERSKHPRRRSMLTGLVICGRCGARMARGVTSYVRAGSRELRPAWKCPSSPDRLGADGKRACGAIVMLAAPLEEHVTEAVFVWADQGKLGALVGKQSTDQRRAGELAAKLADIERRLTELADSHASGRLSLSAYERAVVSHEKRQRELQEQLARLGNVAQSSIVGRCLGRTGALREEWPHLDDDQRRAAVQETIGPLVVLPAGKVGPRVDKNRIIPAEGFVPLRMRGSLSA